MKEGSIGFCPRCNSWRDCWSSIAGANAVKVGKHDARIGWGGLRTEHQNLRVPEFRENSSTTADGCCEGISEQSVAE